MRILFTTALFLIISNALIAQVPRERTVTGRLTDSEGAAMPGVNIVVKGTTTGTTTDTNGSYSIKAPIGSILVFSFIGMQTREVVVTEASLKPVKNSKQSTNNPVALPQWTVSAFQDSTENDREGVATLTSRTPTYKSAGELLNPDAIMSIRSLNKISFRRSLRSYTGYFIRTNDMPLRKGLGLQFSSTVGVERVTQLPSLQSTFAQGRSDGGVLRWRGSDQQEIFSWGPQLKTLEFDGSNYPFDMQGKLVRAGAGNGLSAKPYNTSTFFRQGLNTENELLISVPSLRYSTFSLDAGRKTHYGIIPNSTYSRNNLSAQVKNFKFSERIKGDGLVTYNFSEGSLLNRGANLASVVGSLFSTPVSFDNTNSLSARSATNSSAASQLGDGSVRSYAPQRADNPYGLVKEMPDYERLRRLLSTASIKYGSSHFTLTVNSSYDKQWNNVQYGIPNGISNYPNGRLTKRNEQLAYFSSIITPTYKYYFDGSEISGSLSYQFNVQQRNLKRDDGVGFNNDTWGDISEAETHATLIRSLLRNTHEILANIQFSYDWLNVRLANRNYFSNTISTTAYNNLFPTLSVKVDLVRLLYTNVFDNLQPYASISRTINEAPLLYANGSRLSTQLNPDQYNQFFENQELFFNKNLLPETEQKFEAGVNLRVFSRLEINIASFNNLTDNFVAPQWQNNEFILINAARVKNYGTNISLSYTNYDRSVDWGITWKWSKYNSLVDKLYSSENYIALAGFQSVSSVLAEGKPVGAIYGTSFLRNANGQRVIDSDGFPVVDGSIKMLGSPIPDWALGVESFASLKRFRASVLIDFRKGGDVWNGTQAALNYLGRSAETAAQRNTANYVFDGVDANGIVNTVPVTFYDPAKLVEQNRWVRYGFGGVGEEHIEDTSWIRLSEVALSYTTKIMGARRNSLKFSLVGRNLFLITPYSGVDPSASLFGYSTGTGLDLFNVPTTRSYSLQVTVKI